MIFLQKKTLTQKDESMVIPDPPFPLVLSLTINIRPRCGGVRTRYLTFLSSPDDAVTNKNSGVKGVYIINGMLTNLLFDILENSIYGYQQKVGVRGPHSGTEVGFYQGKGLVQIVQLCPRKKSQKLFFWELFDLKLTHLAPNLKSRLRV